MCLYSVVVPVYNSEHTLQELYTRLEKVFRETIKEEFELILVDDGSRDRSFAVMQELREKDPRVKIIQMARNFGQHPALLCGFAHAKGEFIVTMDDDLQHQPEELPKMINVMKERDDVDVIIASYEGRKHNLIRKLGTKLSVWATSKNARQGSEPSDHQLSTDPPVSGGSHAEDQYISSADWKSSGFKLQPYHQCSGAACSTCIWKERIFFFAAL